MNLVYENLGARIIDCSSEVLTCEAKNLLSDELNSIWLTEEGPPQWFCLSFEKLLIDGYRFTYSDISSILT